MEVSTQPLAQKVTSMSYHHVIISGRECVLLLRPAKSQVKEFQLAYL